MLPGNGIGPGNQHYQEGFIEFIDRVFAYYQKNLVRLAPGHDVIQNRILLSNADKVSNSAKSRIMTSQTYVTYSGKRYCPWLTWIVHYR